MNTDNNGSISDNISHVYFGLELKMQDFKIFNIDNTTFTKDKVITIPEKPINTKYEPTNTCSLIIY